MAIALRRRRFTLEEFQRMGEVGIFGEDDRVELIEGEIIEMSPIGPPHAGGVDRLTMVFTARLGARAIVRVQNPILLPDQGSYLQPDLILLRPRPDFYQVTHPEPPDAMLVVEVMDSSVEWDRRVKLPLYARAGIAQTWLVDLTMGQLETYRDPARGRYGRSAVLGRGDSASPQAFPEVTFSVPELLG